MRLKSFRGQYIWYSYLHILRIAGLTLSRPVKIVGGLHLAGPELADRIKPTVHFLSEALIPAPTYVLPMHCSGFATKVALEAALGEGCVPAGTGHKVIINGIPEDDTRLRPPSIRSH
jgi:7,8-dihydropterin-6-yl-methyl-4-(beta-D-ribofuranosyl)aminobenzene 5'-phosphate synthase